MREITTHKVNGINDGLTVTVRDEPGAGGACHDYWIEWDAKPLNEQHGSPHQVYSINFQNGPLKEVGTNGVTHESLLAILIDRLEGFQRGPFACDENQIALTHLRAAQEALLSRTRARLARSVEGTLEV